MITPTQSVKYILNNPTQKNIVGGVFSHINHNPFMQNNCY
mgnify:CR=1 FL=1